MASTMISPTPTSIGGTAAKGIIRQAKVLACRIVNGAPEADATCVTTTTGSDGSFLATFNDGYTGPAMIKVMAGTSSTMVDETTGADIPYNMTMRALVPAVSRSTTAYVTPFSEMAASAASTGTMDAAKINQSIAAVQAAMSSLGIDLSTMPMVDLKNSASDSNVLARQTNMVKQLGRVAMMAKTSNLFTDANGVPCNAAGNASSQQIACFVSAMAGAMNSYVAGDTSKLTGMMAALTGQDVTNLNMPMLKADGSVSMVSTNMTSSASMQSSLLNGGMNVGDASRMMNIIMGGMH